jgi:DNA-binding CsgD family transcriptional regulator
LQREVVDVLLEHGAAPLEVAQALAESAEPGDRVAVEQLRAAARELLRSDTSAAADLNLRALELVGAGEAPPDSLIAETVLSLSVAMRGDEARALGDRALAHRMSSEEEAAVRLGLSAMLPRSMLVRAEENRRALTLEGLTPVMRARHEAWLAYNLVMSGRFAETAAIAGPALEAAQVSGDVQAIVIATVGLAGLERARGGATRSLALMNQLWALPREAADAPIFSVLDIHHADTFADLGRIDEALRLLEAGVERGRREHNQFLEAWPLYASLMRLRSGQLADARAEAESAEDVFDQAVAGNYIASIAMATLGEVAVHTGDEALLRSATHAALRVQDGTTPAIRRLGAWMLARAAAARQDWAEAVRLLADDELPYAAPSLPNDAGNAPFVTRIALAAGERDLARRAVAVAESFERASPGVVVIGACAAHARGLLDDDAAILLDAARALHGTQRPLLFAAAAEDAGRALARGRRTADAVASLEQAFDAYAEFEAAADARRVGRLLREHGVRRRVGAQRRPDSGWGSLTGSELRVARLIADGASNRDAADQLFLSPHTVSSHLRSAFSKLQINSRVELTRAVLQHDSR